MSNVIWSEIRSTFQRNDRMVYRIVAINVIVFLGLNLFRIPALLMGKPFDMDETFRPDLALPTNLNTLIHKPWTLLTYMFTHFELGHIFYNLLLFFWFGKIMAEFAGNKKILPVYLMGGIAGGALYILAYNLLPVFAGVADHATNIGASASVMAIVFAAVTLVPDYTMFLLLFGAVRIRWIAVAIVIIDLVSTLPDNPGGYIAHVGGYIFGFGYVKMLQTGRDPASGFNRAADRVANIFRKGSNLKVSYKKKERIASTSNKPSASSTAQEKLDLILDKISQSGYDSLTREEKEFLFRVSKED